MVCLVRPYGLIAHYLIALSLVLVFGSAASAQTPGSVDGTVVDITGAAVAGARVEVTVAGRTRSVVTDAAGRYRFDDLPPGSYRIVATHPGLTPSSADAIVAGAAASLDLTLGDVVASESVSVAGKAPVATLDTPTASASRLGLTARETPASVSVMTFTESQARGLATTTEALTRVPGVSAANLPATFATAMRGFTGAAISTLFDGTRSTTSTIVMRNFDSWNFDRIEVLKGPASVLYGEGALAGAVNFVAKRPDFQRRSGEALVSLGSLGSARAAFGATGPVGNGERAAYRADAVVSRSGGYIDDTGSSALNVSGAIDIRLSPAATLSLSADHFRDDYNTAYWGTPLIPAALARQASDLIRDSRGYVLDKSMRDLNFEVTDAVTRSYGTWLRGRLDWRLSSIWRLTNEVYGYDAPRDWRDADTFGFDPGRGLVTRGSTSISHAHRFYGNRLTLASDRRIGGRRNRLSVGVEATRNTFFMPRRFGTTTAVDPFSPVRGTFPTETADNFPGAGNFVDFDTTLTVLSTFVEDAYTLAPRVTVVGGGRVDRFGVDRRVSDRNVGVETGFGRVFRPASGRLGIVVDLVAETQLFAQVTSAVAPVSTIPTISQTNAGFDLTTGRSWEAGLKSSLNHGWFKLTMAAFNVAQDKILTRDPNNANLTIQGGRQSSTGVEITVSANPTAALRLDANASIMTAQFDQLIEAGGIDRSGNVPTNVPERSAGVWATYRFTAWPLTIGAGVRGQGRSFANNANTVRVAGYRLLDAQAGWRVGPGEITVRGKNLGNRFYVDWAPTANQVLIGTRRVVEASYQFRF
jgi:iron complex outermembrane receptor protein